MWTQSTSKKQFSPLLNFHAETVGRQGQTERLLTFLHVFIYLFIPQNISCVFIMSKWLHLSCCKHVLISTRWLTSLRSHFSLFTHVHSSYVPPSTPLHGKSLDHIPFCSTLPTHFARDLMVNPYPHSTRPNFLQSSLCVFFDTSVCKTLFVLFSETILRECL